MSIVCPLSFVISWYEPESGLHLVDFIAPGHQEYADRTVTSGFYFSKCTQCSGREIQSHADFYSGRRFESNAAGLGRVIN